MDGGMRWGVEMICLMYKFLYLYLMIFNGWFEYDGVEEKFGVSFEFIVLLMGKRCVIIGKWKMEFNIDLWLSL